MTKIVDADRFRSKSLAPNTSGGDGGNMDDVLRRLGIVEALVTATREDLSAIKAILPHLATKADVLAHISELRSDMNLMEARLIRWLVGTTIAATSVAFTVAKFVS